MNVRINNPASVAGSHRRWRWLALVVFVVVLLIVMLFGSGHHHTVKSIIQNRVLINKSVMLRDAAPRAAIQCTNSTAYVDKENDCLRNWKIGSYSHVSLPWGSRRKEQMGETGVFLGDFSTSPDEHTIILSAQARGGSSLVTGMIQMMGIPIGNPNRTTVSFHHGDGGYVDACVNLADDKPHAYKEMVDIIRAHDRESEVWAAKQVTTPFQCLTAGKPPIAARLRNPRFIVLFRDIAGIMARAMRMDKHGLSDAIDRVRPGSFLKNIDLFTGRQLKMIEGLKWLVDRNYPVFFVGLSRAYKNPEGFIRDLESFVGHRFNDRCVPLQVMTGGNYLGFC
eukprot:TRINITY_DN8028_c0_g1_i1.p1 TRINITY_DN8028_c0_g1~~TRINITY_DN8028_c0_g1_i1.p1  ORF type:complete len:337 (-),score=30.19 TRINITY_DN8028_c0_g1_i1:115-1125(-)